MAYKLELTADDMDTISFVGYRYSWSDALAKHCHEGTNDLPEHVAWELQDAFTDDCEGGHSYFPMLDDRSELATKLYNFMDSII